MKKTRSHPIQNRAVQKTATALGVLALMMGSATTARADDANQWVVTPSITQYGEWDSNPLMRRQAGRDLYGSVTEPRVSIVRQAPTAKITVGGTLKQRVYNQTAFNSTDAHLRGTVEIKNRRWKVQLKATGDHDTTRTSEVTPSGTMTKAEKHQAAMIAPELSYAFSPLTQFGLASSYSVSRYDSQDDQDYQILSLSPSIVRQLTPQASALIALQAQRYETIEGDKTTTTRIGPAMGGAYAVDDHWTITGRLGIEAAQERDRLGITHEWTWNSVYALQIDFKGDVDTVNLSATRAQQAFSNGTDSLLTALSAQVKRAVTPSLDLQTTARYEKADYGTDRNGELDTQTTGEVRGAYKIFDQMNASLSYRHRRKTLTGDEAIIRQNTAMVGLSYRW